MVWIIPYDTRWEWKKIAWTKVWGRLISSVKVRHCRARTESCNHRPPTDFPFTCNIAAQASAFQNTFRGFSSEPKAEIANGSHLGLTVLIGLSITRTGTEILLWNWWLHDTTKWKPSRTGVSSLGGNSAKSRRDASLKFGYSSAVQIALQGSFAFVPASPKNLSINFWASFHELLLTLSIVTHVLPPQSRSVTWLPFPCVRPGRCLYFLVQVDANLLRCAASLY